MPPKDTFVVMLRYKPFRWAQKHITSVLVKEDKSKTKADSRARIQTSQDNLKLTPLEQARNYRNMRELDKLTSAGASKVNKETVHVIQTLQLLGYAERKSSLTFVLALIAAHPARELVRDYGAEQAQH